MSMGLSWQEYRSGLTFPLPRDLPNLGIKHTSPAWQLPLILVAGFFTTEPPGKPRPREQTYGYQMESAERDKFGIYD